jgi:hypothetical protein
LARECIGIAPGRAIGFHGPMRFLAFLCLLLPALSGAVPEPLAEALATFRSEPPRGWSFTQTTVGDGKSTMERYDAAKPEFDRWTLIQKDGRSPTAADLKAYSEGRSRRSRTGTAPSLTDQIDRDSLETVAENDERATYRCRLRRGESRDDTSLHLRATLVLHKPTRTLESIELTNAETFRPTIGVKIVTMKTLMTYSAPSGDRPGLPQQVSTHLRGTAFWFKSLDADLTVTFSDYVRTGKR